MTRIEKILQAAQEYTSSGDYSPSLKDCFIAGVKWVDDNPKKGMVSLDEVCKYLDEELYTSFDYFGNVETTSKDSIDKKEFIENFRKAMEK